MWPYFRGTSCPLGPLYGMEVGNILYHNGTKMGVVVYLSAFSLRDSKNPQFASIDKASQFSLIVEAPENFGTDLTGHWEVGHDEAKRGVRILSYHYSAPRAIMTIELLTAGP